MTLRKRIADPAHSTPQPLSFIALLATLPGPPFVTYTRLSLAPYPSLSHSLPHPLLPWLQPEGRATPEIYVQGFSTGLPERLQLALLRTLPGLEDVRMLRPAYAVEYDYLPAHQCQPTLETKRIQGLFFSGQLNGTTGDV